MGDCLFCKIIDREIPGDIVYEDDKVLAFNDINPVAPYHILVIPKKHIKSLNEIENVDEKIISKIMFTIKNIAKEQGFAEEGYRVINNCGENGGQEVAHLHFHVLAGKKLGEKII